MYSSISKTSVSWSNHGLSVIRNGLLPHLYGGSVTTNELRLCWLYSLSAWSYLWSVLPPPRTGLVSAARTTTGVVWLGVRSGATREYRAQLVTRAVREHRLSSTDHNGDA